MDAAVLVLTADADESLLRRIAEEIPTVHVDRAVGMTDAVVGDNAAGTSAAVDHLVALGHRRIALVNGDERLPTALGAATASTPRSRAMDCSRPRTPRGRSRSSRDAG